MKIDETKAFKALPPLSQQMALKRVNRLQIEDAIIIARTIGIEQWKASTPLQPRWQQIVVEIIENENKKYGVCCICGCTDLDCSNCIEVSGKPCYWVDDEHTLCSRCYLEACEKDLSKEDFEKLKKSM